MLIPDCLGNGQEYVVATVYYLGMKVVGKSLKLLRDPTENDLKYLGL
jgi:hypothetical protein